MYDNFFARDVTRMPLGTRVRFPNKGRAVHNAVAADGSWRTPVQVPTDQAATVVVDHPGVYRFYCSFREELKVIVPSLVIRGRDRNRVVIDGDRRRPNGISVTADGVVVENLTVRNALASLGQVAEANTGAYPHNRSEDQPAPPPQAQLPGGAGAPVRPAMDVFAAARVDLAAAPPSAGSRWCRWCRSLAWSPTTSSAAPAAGLAAGRGGRRRPGRLPGRARHRRPSGWDRLRRRGNRARPSGM
jgi:hypothetical protein